MGSPWVLSVFLHVWACIFHIVEPICISTVYPSQQQQQYLNVGHLRFRVIMLWWFHGHFPDNEFTLKIFISHV